ncbi:MAG: hypothetical protein ABIJ27_06970 [Candidatus Omnitrophota bacterium]
MVATRALSILIIIQLIMPAQGFAQTISSGRNENLNPFYISQILEVLDKHDTKIKSLSEDTTPGRARPDDRELSELFGERAEWFRKAWVQKVAECTARDIVRDVRGKCGDVHYTIIKDILIQRIKIRALLRNVPRYRRDALIKAIGRQFPVEKPRGPDDDAPDIIHAAYLFQESDDTQSRQELKRASPSSGETAEIDPEWNLRQLTLDLVPPEFTEGRIDDKFNGLNKRFRRIKEEHSGVTPDAAEALRTDVLVPAKEILEYMRPFLDDPQARKKIGGTYFAARARIFGQILSELARAGSPLQKEARTLMLSALPLSDKVAAHAEAIEHEFSSKGASWQPQDGSYKGETDTSALIGNVFTPLEWHLEEVVARGIYDPNTDPAVRGMLLSEKNKAVAILAGLAQKGHEPACGILLDKVLGDSAKHPGGFREEFWTGGQVQQAYRGVRAYLEGLESQNKRPSNYILNLINEDLIQWFGRMEDEAAGWMMRYAVRYSLRKAREQDRSLYHVQKVEWISPVAELFQQWGEIFTARRYAACRRAFFSELTGEPLLPIDVRSLLYLAGDVTLEVDSGLREIRRPGEPVRRVPRPRQMRDAVIEYLTVYFRLFAPFNDQEMLLKTSAASMASSSRTGQEGEQNEPYNAPLAGYMYYINSIGHAEDRRDWGYLLTRMLHLQMFRSFQGLFGREKGLTGLSGELSDKLRELATQEDAGTRANVRGPAMPDYIRCEVHMYPTCHTADLVRYFLEWELTGDSGSLLAELDAKNRRHPHAHRVREEDYLDEDRRNEPDRGWKRKTPYDWLMMNKDRGQNEHLARLCAAIADAVSIPRADFTIPVLADASLVTDDVLQRCINQLDSETGDEAEKLAKRRTVRFVKLYRLLVEIYGPQQRERIVAALRDQIERNRMVDESLKAKAQNLGGAIRAISGNLEDGSTVGGVTAYLDSDVSSLEREWLYPEVEAVLGVVGRLPPGPPATEDCSGHLQALTELSGLRAALKEKLMDSMIHYPKTYWDTGKSKSSRVDKHGDNYCLNYEENDLSFRLYYLDQLISQLENSLMGDLTHWAGTLTEGRGENGINLQKCQSVARMLHGCLMLLANSGLGNHQLEIDLKTLNEDSIAAGSLTAASLAYTARRIKTAIGTYTRGTLDEEFGEIVDAVAEGLDDPGRLNPDIRAALGDVSWDAAKSGLKYHVTNSLVNSQSVLARLEGILEELLRDTHGHKGFLARAQREFPALKIWPDKEPVQAAEMLHAIPQDPSLDAVEYNTEKGRSLVESAEGGCEIPPFSLVRIGEPPTMATAEVKIAKIDEVLAGFPDPDRFGRSFGEEPPEGYSDDSAIPALLSFRLAAIHDMPGQLPTVTNVGISFENTESLIQRVMRMIKSRCPKPENMKEDDWEEEVRDCAQWTVFDSLRRFYQEYAMLVFDRSAPRVIFDGLIGDFKKEKRVDYKIFLTGDQMEELARRYLQQLNLTFPDQDIPNEPREQVREIMRAIEEQDTWDKTKEYRRMIGMTGMRGSAGPGVAIQAQVFGNIKYPEGTGVHSGTGVAWLNTFGEVEGSWAPSAQGFDVVDGVVSPQNITQLAVDCPEAYESLKEWLVEMTNRYGHEAEFEFTVQSGEAFVLQARMAMFQRKRRGFDKESLANETVLAQGQSVAVAGGFNCLVITPETIDQHPGLLLPGGEIYETIKKEGLDGCALFLDQADPEKIRPVRHPLVIAVVTKKGGLGAHINRILQSEGKGGIFNIEGGFNFVRVGDKHYIKFAKGDLVELGRGVIALDADPSSGKIYRDRQQFEDEVRRSPAGTIDQPERRSPTGVNDSLAVLQGRHATKATIETTTRDIEYLMRRVDVYRDAFMKDKTSSGIAVIMRKGLPEAVTGDLIDISVRVKLEGEYNAMESGLRNIPAVREVEEVATEDELVARMNHYIENGMRVIVLDDNTLTKNMEDLPILGVPGKTFCAVQAPSPEDLADNEIPLVLLNAMYLMGWSMLEGDTDLFSFTYELCTGFAADPDDVLKVKDNKLFIIKAVPRSFPVDYEDRRIQDKIRKVFAAAA